MYDPDSYLFPKILSTRPQIWDHKKAKTRPQKIDPDININEFMNEPLKIISDYRN